MNTQQKADIINRITPKLSPQILEKFDNLLATKSYLAFKGKEREEFYAEYEKLYRDSLEQICRMMEWNFYHSYAILKHKHRSYLEYCDNYAKYLSMLLDAIESTEKERLENALIEIPQDHLDDLEKTQIDDSLVGKEYLYGEITKENLNDTLLGFIPFEKQIIALRIGLINNRQYSATQIANILNTSCILVRAIIKRFERYAEWEYIRKMPCT